MCKRCIEKGVFHDGGGVQAYLGLALAWMPPNVDDRLRQASIDARIAEARVTRFEAELRAAERDAADRERIMQRLSHAEGLAARMGRRRAELEEIAEVRQAAVALVADVYERAQFARDESLSSARPAPSVPSR